MSTDARERPLFLKPVPLSSLHDDALAFLTAKEAEGVSPKTRKIYSDELRGLVAFLEARGVHHVRDVAPTDLRAYLLALAERRNPGGCHIAFRVMRTFLLWWERETEPRGWSNPIRKVKAPKLRPEPLEPVSLETVKAMLQACDGKTLADARDKALIMALLDSGLRASEFLALNLEDVNLATGAVRVQQGKGGKWRTVFLSPKTRLAVRRYLRLRGDVKDNEPLWAAVDGRRLAYEGLRQILRRRAMQAGVPAPSPHDFRRAAALLMLRNGIDLVSLQRLLGHSDLSVIQRYLKQTQDDLAEAHQRASPVNWL